MNNLIEKYNKGLGGPKPSTGSGASPVKSPAAPASLPPVAVCRSSRRQLKEALPVEGVVLCAMALPSSHIPPEPDLPRRQTLKSPTLLPKI